MVEAMANSVEDYLIDGLSFKLQPGASYIQQRRAVSFYTSGSNVYSPSGTKVVRIQLNGDDWLDPSSVRVMFKLKNIDTNPNHRLRPLCGPWSFFRRVRILCGGGQLVEDISDYNRLHEMLSILQSSNSRANDDAEGFGTRWDDSQKQVYYDVKAPVAPSTLPTVQAIVNAPSIMTLPGIKGNSYKYVGFRLKCGIFNQPKFIPLRYCPLTIELEVCNSLTDPIISNLGITSFTAANTSTVWEIEDVQIKASVVSLDNALANSYTEHLLKGGALPLQYTQYFTLQQTISGSSPTVTITRSASRLKEAYFTLTDTTTINGSVLYNTTNLFYHPMFEWATGADMTLYPPYDATKEVEWDIQIGSRLFPETNCRSVSESFKFLREILHLPDMHQHSVDITEEQYRVDKFIMAFDFQRVAEAGYTGINTKAGDLMVFKMRPAPGAAFTGDIANTLYATLAADCILEIKDTGCSVYD